MALSVSVLTSRIAGYLTRMSGGVGEALSDGLPIPIWTCVDTDAVCFYGAVVCCSWQFQFLLLPVAVVYCSYFVICHIHSSYHSFSDI